MATDIDRDHIAFLVGDLARHFRAAFERAIETGEVGLTTSEARVLSQVARCGPIRQSCLADLLCVAPMSLSVFLDGLEKAGLVRRDPDPDDRRAKLVSLTGASGPALERMETVGRRLRAAALEGIAPEDREKFSEVARQMRTNLETLRGLRAAEVEV
ncbi:MarR family winged helix-turn-helix transcriptional regulator [Oceaniglobus roseus]|uniref:MarR family winged helix-turn-helix transcriptional regulator n=1 Tax=Oceaniglobus roseus TaxID=1737570 RepID=UPI0015622370|nr:MarR family transcriptional regulator [Kandeliimicrobium roseum]